MLHIILSVLTINEIVVKKNGNELPKVILENIIHGRWCIGKAEQHYDKLIVAMVNLECHFVYILLGHPDLIVSHTLFNFGEDCSSMKLI